MESSRFKESIHLQARELIIFTCIVGISVSVFGYLRTNLIDSLFGFVLVSLMLWIVWFMSVPIQYYMLNGQSS